MMADNANLKDVVLNGHRWWILNELVPVERQVDISLWRNMDQNENQATHEIEILQSIKATAENLSQKQTKVTQGDLVACVQEEPCQGESSCLDEPLQVLHRVSREWCGGPCE